MFRGAEQALDNITHFIRQVEQLWPGLSRIGVVIIAAMGDLYSHTKLNLTAKKVGVSVSSRES